MDLIETMPGAPWFMRTLDENFPGAMPATVFVGRTYEQLFELGFDEHSAIACVATCRDELTHPLVNKIAMSWGSAFNFSSLAGMLFLGQTGFRAALAHAPRVGVTARYVFFILPHIGLGPNGTLGTCQRRGQPILSKACGALCAVEDELAAGVLSLDLAANDPEQSLLKRTLGRHIEVGSTPSLLHLTQLTLRSSLESLEHLIDLCVDTSDAQYGVVSGILVHGPDGRDFVQPGPIYAVTSAGKQSLATCGPCP